MLGIFAGIAGGATGTGISPMTLYEPRSALCRHLKWTHKSCNERLAWHLKFIETLSQILNQMNRMYLYVSFIFANQWADTTNYVHLHDLIEGSWLWENVVCFPLRRRINKTHLDPLIRPQGLISIVTLHPVFCLLAAFNHPVFDNRPQLNLFDRRHRLQSTKHHSTIVSSRKIASDRVKDRIFIQEYLSRELSCRTELKKSNGRRMRWGLKICA